MFNSPLSFVQKLFLIDDHWRGFKGDSGRFLSYFLPSPLPSSLLGLSRVRRRGEELILPLVALQGLLGVGVRGQLGLPPQQRLLEILLASGNGIGVDGLTLDLVRQIALVVLLLVPDGGGPRPRAIGGSGSR